MKVKIIDSRGGQYRCDSADYELIGRWFIEHASRLLAEGDGHLPMYLYVWPASTSEADALRIHGGGQVTPERLRSLADTFTTAAQWLEQ